MNLTFEEAALIVVVGGAAMVFCVQQMIWCQHQINRLKVIRREWEDRTAAAQMQRQADEIEALDDLSAGG